MPVHTVPATSPDGRRLRSIPPTIFSEMSALARAHRQPQPRPGLPGPGRSAPVRSRPRSRRCGPAATSTRPVPATPSCARRSPRTRPRHYGIELDPASEVVVTAGATEALAAAIFALREPRRRDGGARAVLRLLRRVHRDGRRRTAPGDPARAGLPARRRRAAGRRHAAHHDDPAEHPAQPDRRGARPGPSSRRSPRSRSSTTWWWSPTRSTSTCSSTAARTSRSARCPGCGSAR